MRAFAAERRDWLDHRPCLVWDMHRSINESLRAADQETEYETVEVTEGMVMMLSAILRLSLNTATSVPSDEGLRDYMNRFAPKYIEQLERDPDGRVARAAQQSVAGDGASRRS